MDAKKNHGFLLDDLYLLHDPGSRHPESPRRLKAIDKGLASHGAAQRWQRIEPRPARLEELELVHRPGHVERIEKAARRAPSHLDPDTVVSAESYRIGLFAAGGVLKCVEEICSGNLRRAFAFVRPAGTSRGARQADGLLPVQQCRSRSGLCSPRLSSQSRRHCGH